MLKLKLQYFDHLMQRADSLAKILILGRIEGGMRRGRQRMRWLDGTTDSRDTSLSKHWDWWWTEKPGMLQFMGSQELDTTEQLNWLLMCFWVKVWWTFQPASYFLLTFARAAWTSWTPRHQIAITSERLIHWSSHCAGRATEAAQRVPGKMSLESCSPNSMTAALSSQQVFAC